MRCLLAQWIAARRLDDGAELPRWTRRHLARCPACATQEEHHRRLAAQLARDADAVRREPPPFLHARIMANLDAPASARRLSPLWGVVAAGVAAVVLVLAFNRAPDPVSPAPLGTAGNVSPAAVGAFAFLPALPGQETVLALGTNLAEPLETEIRLVMDDARTALAALTRNFLPTDPGEPRR